MRWGEGKKMGAYSVCQIRNTHALFFPTVNGGRALFHSLTETYQEAQRSSSRRQLTCATPAARGDGERSLHTPTDERGMQCNLTGARQPSELQFPSCSVGFSVGWRLFIPSYFARNEPPARWGRHVTRTIG